MTDGDLREWKVTLDFPQAQYLAGLGASVTLIEDATQTLAAVELDDDDVAALRVMPAVYQQRITMRLLELAEVLREVLQNLDLRLLELTARSE